MKLNTAQKRGLLIVLVALVLVIGWRWRSNQLAAHSTVPESDSLQPTSSKAIRVELNTADTTQLQTVKGIGSTTARRIVRYRELIGGYTATDQLLQIPGMTPENFLRVEEQVYVDTTTADFAALRKRKPSGKSRPAAFFQPKTYPERSYPAGNANGGAATTPATTPQHLAASTPKPVRMLDLNTADSTDLVSISGIGPSTARNILKYRSLIFYFDNLDQLGEVWGIRPENLERMKPFLTVGDSRKVMPHLRINEMSVDEMGRHKYLGFKEARILVAYREMHGPFVDFAAVQKVQGIAVEKFVKLEPYLVY